KPGDRYRVAASLEGVERLVVNGLLDRRASRGGRLRRAGRTRGPACAGAWESPLARGRGIGAAAGTSCCAPTWQCAQPLVEVVVQILLLLAHRLGTVLELVDAAAQLAHGCLHLIQMLRELNQALVGNDALDARQADIDVVQLDLNRILF